MQAAECNAEKSDAWLSVFEWLCFSVVFVGIINHSNERKEC